MPPTVAAAYPFIETIIDTRALLPVAQRSPGVIAIVGVSTTGDAAPNTPILVDSAQDVADRFGAGSVLAASLRLALLQDPRPSRIYGVKVAGTGAAADYTQALDSLNAADDVGFVALAQVTDPTLLLLLKQHVETNSANGQKRLGVVMVNPATNRSPSYVADVVNAYHPSGNGPDLMSTVSRMVVVAARGATLDDGSTVADVASAAMAAMAGHPPSASIVLKRVRGIRAPVASQYSPTEIKQLSEAGIIPIIQPALIVGGGYFFGEGRCFTSDASLLYVDIVRTLDDIDFRIKAGLIGQVGDARITRAGLTTLRSAVEGILGPLQRAGTIEGFTVQIPVLELLALPESTRSPAETALITTARANRAIDLLVSVTYGPAVHRLRVTLQPKF